MSSSPHLEILDLRHFTAAQLAPLLRDEAFHWQQRLRWDYAKAIALLLEYIDGRILPGFVALEDRRIAGYAFAVLEAGKAVIGDVYAFQEAGGATKSISETLLLHLLEMLEATPGVDRIESQLLMFPTGALHRPFFDRGFKPIPRCFMLAELNAVRSTTLSPIDQSQTLSSFRASGPRTSVLGSFGWKAGESASPPPLPAPPQDLHLSPWRPELQDPAARLIHAAYQGHMDANINDQYRSVSSAHRFLHNIIRFPGCGLFDPEHSWALRVPGTADLAALLLTSRVRADTAHITQLCVAPSFRRHGLGDSLLTHAAQQLHLRGLTHLSLTVTEANFPAIRLYERHGFQTVHRFEAMVWDRAGS